MRRLLTRIAVDITPLRVSRDLRRLLAGNLVSSLGTEAALVALPYQVYVETRSAFLTGLLGAAELVPLVLVSLLGGALADQHDRRRLLLLDQIALVLVAAVLAAFAFAGSPPLLVLYVLAGLMAGFGALQNVVRAAIVPNLVPPELLRSALALNYGLIQLALVLGPAVAGVLIATLGVGAAYTADAVTCLAMVGALASLPPQLPQGAHGASVPIRQSIAEGLRFVRGNQALLGSFVIDLCAMTFGMPRALFAALAVGLYDAGAAGTGLLYSAVAAGAVVAALTAGWITRAHRLGLIVIWSVVAWGAAIALSGVAGSLWLAALLLAVAGFADSVSAVCRSTINQMVTPDRLRGRMSSVFSLVVRSGPRLGDVESGIAAAIGGVRFSFVSGGLLTIAGVGVVIAAFPALRRYDTRTPPPVS